MKFFAIAAMALALSIPATAMAATNGSPGTTSTGTVHVNLQVNPPAGDTVHIFGLEDITIPAITRVAGQATGTIFSSTDKFCIVRSGANSNAPVNVTVTHAGGTSTTGRYSLTGESGKILDGVLVYIFSTDGSAAVGTSNHGSIFTVAPSLSGCSETTVSSDANSILFELPSIPADSTIADGALTQTFALLVTPS